MRFISNLVGSIGFARTVRASAYIVLGMVIIGNLLMRTAYTKKYTDGPQMNILGFFTDLPYMFAALGWVMSEFCQEMYSPTAAGPW